MCQKTHLFKISPTPFSRVTSLFNNTVTSINFFWLKYDRSSTIYDINPGEFICMLV